GGGGGGGGVNERPGPAVADADRAVDAGEIGRVERGVDHAGEVAGRVGETARCRGEPAAGAGRLEWRRDEQPGVRIVALGGEIGAWRDGARLYVFIVRGGQQG